jgi:hypothetical protein
MMSPAAPLAGVRVTTAPTAVAVISAALEGDRKMLQGRLRFGDSIDTQL